MAGGSTTQLGIAQIPIRATLDDLDKDLSKARAQVDKGVKSISASVAKGVLGAEIVKLGVRAVSQLARGVVQGVKQAVALASTEEQGINRLAAAVRASGGDWGRAQGAIENYLLAEQKRIALDDGEGRESLGRLVTATGDYRKAMDLLPLAADLAVAKNMDLAQAAELVGKVYAGNTGTLSRYGIVLDKGATATEALGELQKRFAGQAEAWAAANEGGAKKLDVTINNLKETFGAKLLPVLGQTRQKLADALMRPEISRAVEDLAGKLGVFIDKGLSWILDNSAAIAGGLKAIAVALGAVAVAALAVQIVTHTLNPLMLVITGITLAAGALGAAWATNWNGIRDKTREVVTALIPLITRIIKIAAYAKYIVDLLNPKVTGQEAWARYEAAIEGADSAAVRFVSTLGTVKQTTAEWIDSVARSVGVTIDSAAVLERLRGGLFAVKPAADTAAGSIEGLGVAAADARDWVSGLQAALIATHPATIAAASAVASLQSAISGVNGELAANGERLQAAQDKLQGLNDKLATAKERLAALSAPKLAGMGEGAMQIEAIEAQLKRIDLARSLKVPIEDVVAQYPLLTAGAEDYLATLPTTKSGLQKMLDQLKLIESLKYDEKLKLLGEAANPPAAEMTYEDALAGIADTNKEISSLTKQISAQEAEVRSLQAANDALNASLDAYNAQLQEAQAQQALVAQGLQLAYDWFLKDRQALIDMGGSAATQAGVVDDKARALLLAISGFATGTTTLSQETLAGLISSFQSSSATAVEEVNRSLSHIPRDIYTTHHIATVYEGGGAATPGMAAGGAVSPGVAYLVGERGPELFMPRFMGQVIPAAETERILSQGDTITSSKELHLHLTTMAPLSLASEFRMLEALA